MKWYCWLALGLCAVALWACDVSELGQTITATPNLTPQTASAVAPTVPLQSPTASLTPFPSATLDPKATPVPLDICTLVNKDEAASAIGEPVLDPIAAGGGCVYVDSDTAQYVMSFYALPSNANATLIAGRTYILEAYGILIPQSDVQNLQALGKQGDAKGVVDGLLTLSKNPNGFTAEALDGVGDAGIWVSKVIGVERQGFLLTAHGTDLVGLDILVTSARDETSVRDAARAVVRAMLERLPQRYVVSLPTPVPTATLAISRTPSATGQATVTGTITKTVRAPTATVRATQTLAPSATATLAQTTSQAVTPTLKPPAFSVPIVSNDQVTYGGQCGLSLVTITATVVDPSEVSAIASVDLFVRVTDPLSGRATDWNKLAMRSDARDLWLRTVNAETELPGHDAYANGFIEYYFLATNAAGVTAESPHYGVLSNPLVLTACATSTPTP